MSSLPIIYPDFDSSIINSSITTNGWSAYDQGSSGSNVITTYAGRKAGSATAAGGLWYTAIKGGSYGDFDLRTKLICSVSSDIVITVRNQNSAGWLDNCYGLYLQPGASTMYIVKQCGGSQFIKATFSSRPHNLTNLNSIRITMQGLLMTAYFNNALVGSFDFTGDVSCGSAAYNTGGFGFRVSSAKTARFYPDYPQPSLRLV